MTLSLRRFVLAFCAATLAACDAMVYGAYASLYRRQVDPLGYAAPVVPSVLYAPSGKLASLWNGRDHRRAAVSKTCFARRPD